MNKGISVDAALSRARANNFGRMMGRGKDNRVEPECWPQISPSFQFAKDQTFFAIGSCFAQNITKHLALDGYNVHGSSVVEGNRRNRYTPAAIWQELAWASQIFHRDDTVRDEDITPLLLEIGPDRFVDIWSRPERGAPLNHEAAIAARRELYAHFRGAFLADVVIITLGLIEAWWDEISRTYVEFDPSWARLPDCDRFRFQRLGFIDCKDFVERTVALLGADHRRILITTSPVVLARTFTADDIIVANTHSKSVLRAVAGEIAETHDRVDYFPSYEIATITRNPEVWDDDLIHINPSFIARIMRHVTDAYVPGARSESEQALMRMANLVEGLQFKAAADIYDSNLHDARGSSNLAAHVAAARLSAWRDDHQGAIFHASRIAGADREVAVNHPDWVLDAGRLLNSASGTAKDGTALLNLLGEVGREKPHVLLTALTACERTRNELSMRALIGLIEPLQINHPDIAWKMSGQLQGWGELERALAVCQRQLSFTPDNPKMMRRLARLQLTQGALDKACASLRNLVNLEPHDGWARHTLARTLVKLGRDVDALEQLEALEAFMPDHAQGLALSARLLWKNGQRDRASALAIRAVENAGSDPSILGSLSSILAAST